MAANLCLFILLALAARVRNVHCGAIRKPVVLSCGSNCITGPCYCGLADWYWTNASQPQKYITEQIWAKIKGRPFELNSACQDQLTARILTPSFDLEILHVPKLEGQISFCCFNGHIQFGTPRIHCESLGENGNMNRKRDSTHTTITMPMLTKAMISLVFAVFFIVSTVWAYLLIR